MDRINSLMAIGVFVALISSVVLIKYKPELFTSHLVPAAIDPRPVLWWVTDNEQNSRNWADFGARQSKKANKGYTEVALQVALKTQGSSFRIEVLEGRTAVLQQIRSAGGSLPALPEQLPPKLWKGWSRAALLASSGGLYVDGDSVLFLGPSLLPALQGVEAAFFGVNPDEPRVSPTTAVAPGPSPWVGWARSSHHPGWDLAAKEWLAVIAPGAPSYSSAIARRVEQEIAQKQRESGVEVLREPEGSRRSDGTNLIAEDVWGRQTNVLHFPPSVVYLAVDGEQLEKSTSLQWALRLSPDQLRESDLVWPSLARKALA